MRYKKKYKSYTGYYNINLTLKIKLTKNQLTKNQLNNQHAKIVCYNEHEEITQPS